jgi:uncharacterized protein
MPSTIDQLRHFALQRSLFKPCTLSKAVERLGFVQADPIRAPARAQDLILRHRVHNYQAGDLEKRYPTLALEEDFFINYGYLPRATQALMHPRQPRQAFTAKELQQVQAVLAFMQGRSSAHPREVEAHFQWGQRQNWFGGQSNAATHLLDRMHFHGLLRVAKRESGTRVYALRSAQNPIPTALERDAALDALLDVAVQQYAPLPASSLGQLATYLMRGVPQWRAERQALLQRARARLNRVQLEGSDWFWPADEALPRRTQARQQMDEPARLLAPFDPLVWDRTRFERFWGWAYRFEAYTPAPKRQLGYYALPLLWQGQVLGWGNAREDQGCLHADIGLVNGHKRSPQLARALDTQLQAMAEFLRLQAFSWHWQ